MLKENYFLMFCFTVKKKYKKMLNTIKIIKKIVNF